MRSIASGVQFSGGFGNHAALIARARELVFTGLAAAVTARDRGRAIGRSTRDLIELHLAGEAVVEAHDRQSEMQEVGDNRKQRGFLAPMLSSGRGEGTADLAVQGAFQPQATGLVEEV